MNAYSRWMSFALILAAVSLPLLLSYSISEEQVESRSVALSLSLLLTLWLFFNYLAAAARIILEIRVFAKLFSPGAATYMDVLLAIFFFMNIFFLFIALFPT